MAMQRLSKTSGHVTCTVADTAAAATKTDGDRLLFTGCYTDSTPFLFGTAGEGILAFSVGAEGQLTPLSGGKAVPAGTNPTYLVANADGTRLYCANEAEPSSVCAFAIDRTPGTELLTPLNTVSAEGLGACWVTLSPDEKFLLATNYTSGSVVSFPIIDSGVGEAVSVAAQAGLKSLGPNTNRQDGPHAHAVMFSPVSSTDCYVPDLGMDMCWHYKFDPETGSLTLAQDTSMPADGVAMGPRHIAMHPSGNYAYITNEMGSSVTPIRIDMSTGAMSVCGPSLSTTPDEWTEASTTARVDCMFTDRPALISHCAHIAIHPTGRWVYASNRGHDSIAVFAVSEANGTLSRSDIMPTGGETPRNFQIDPTGTLLLAGNQDSDSVVAFSIDQATGCLTPTGSSTAAPSPVALCFV